MSIKSYSSPGGRLDKAVVGLLEEGSIQFINTTNNTKDNKIYIGEMCVGVTAGKDKIYIGGLYKVIILNTDGSLVREIATDGFTYNLLFIHVLKI
jgi:hypothetical protein